MKRIPIILAMALSQPPGRPRAGRRFDEEIHGPSFIALWRDFLIYNQRARILKGHLEAYTLPEAVALLKDSQGPRHRVIRMA